MIFNFHGHLFFWGGWFSILGIGHKIKSRNNPDLRVEIIKNFAKSNFPSTKLLDYALAVEEITTTKKDSLILNLDGAIAVCFVDLLRESGAFTREEAEEYIKIGALNGLFVLGRSIGFTGKLLLFNNLRFVQTIFCCLLTFAFLFFFFLGHYLDQKRLKQGLYRHPWDDISYLSPGAETGRTFVNPDEVDKKGA